MMARIETESGHSSSGEEEDVDGDIWEARRIVDEKNGKFYIEWEGEDEKGRPYPNTWEPRVNCGAGLLQDWEERKARKERKWAAAEAEKKEKKERKRSREGSSSKPSSSVKPAESQNKRKRESLPAPTAESSSSGSQLKKVRRQTVDTVARTYTSPVPQADSTPSALNRRLAKAAQLHLEASNEDMSVDVAEPSSATEALASTSSTNRQPVNDQPSNDREAPEVIQPEVESADKGKAREDPASPGPDASAPFPVTSQAQPGLNLPSTSASPASTQVNLAPTTALTSSNSTESASTPRAPASPAPVPGVPQFRRINNTAAARPALTPIPTDPRVSGAVASSSTTKVFKPIQPSSQPSAPSPTVTVSELSNSLDSQQGPDPVAEVASGSAQPSPAAAAEVPPPRPKTLFGGVLNRPHKQRPLDAALAASSHPGVSPTVAASRVGDTLNPVKPLAPSQPVPNPPLSLSTSSTSSFRSSDRPHRPDRDIFPPFSSSSSHTDRQPPHSPRGRLTDPKPVLDAEDLSDQEIIALPGPSGDMDEGIPRRRSSQSPTRKKQLEKKYLETAELNRKYRLEIAELKAARDATAPELERRAELVMEKEDEIRKHKKDHAETRRVLQVVEGQVELLEEQLAAEKRRLEEARSTEQLLRDLHESGVQNAREQQQEIQDAHARIRKLNGQLQDGINQVRAFYETKIKSDAGQVEVARNQLKLFQDQHQRTGDAVRDKAALVPGLQSEVAVQRRTLSTLREQLSEAREDRDVAEARVERLEDEKRNRAGGAPSSSYAFESDSDDSGSDYRPPGTGTVAAVKVDAPVSRELSNALDDDDDEESPLSLLLSQQPSNDLIGVQAKTYGGDSPLSAGATSDMAILMDRFNSRSTSPTSSLLEIDNDVSVVSHPPPAPLARISTPTIPSILGDLHPSPNSVFGSQNHAHPPLPSTSQDGVFPAGTANLQALHLDFGRPSQSQQQE